MDNIGDKAVCCFKPCYKWITFNTYSNKENDFCFYLCEVLNLVINGLPSILLYIFHNFLPINFSFKPCYKWITFNTKSDLFLAFLIYVVLNLVINGLPSILQYTVEVSTSSDVLVLNLVINGLPSILYFLKHQDKFFLKGFKPCYKWITFNTKGGVSTYGGGGGGGGFKPCYKWITFNTRSYNRRKQEGNTVLNLVINGLPSIRTDNNQLSYLITGRFKPCYKWITFNTGK